MSIHIKLNPASMAEKRRFARSIAYLGTVDKILTAMANEFGTDVTMPSIKFLELVTFERRNQRIIEGGKHD